MDRLNHSHISSLLVKRDAKVAKHRNHLKLKTINREHLLFPMWVLNHYLGLSPTDGKTLTGTKP